MLKYILLQYMYTCGGQNNGSPPNFHGLVPIPCDYITLYGKRDFADAIKAFSDEEVISD